MTYGVSGAHRLRGVAGLGASIGWGVLIGASLLAGALLATVVKLPARVAAVLTAFGGGILFAAQTRGRDLPRCTRRRSGHRHGARAATSRCPPLRRRPEGDVRDDAGTVRVEGLLLRVVHEVDRELVDALVSELAQLGDVIGDGKPLRRSTAMRSPPRAAADERSLATPYAVVAARGREAVSPSIASSRPPRSVSARAPTSTRPGATGWRGRSCSTCRSSRSRTGRRSPARSRSAATPVGSR